MGKNLKGKTAFIVALLVVFVYGIFGIPHGLSGTALKQALLDRISLGLDLKGGIHLVLQVHVAEAVGLTTDRDVSRLQDDLAKAGVAGATVGKHDPVAHPEAISIGAVPAASASAARGILQGNDYSNYDVSTNSSGGWNLTMKPAAVTDL